MKRDTGTPSAADLLARIAELEGQVGVLAKDNRSLARDVGRLTSELAETARERDDALAAYNALEAKMERIVEQYRIQAARVWGRSSEAGQGQLPLLFNDAELAADGGGGETAAAGAAGPARRRRAKRRVDWAAYETVVVEHGLPEGESLCPACGAELSPMGYDVRRELVFVPARVYVREHRIRKYVCAACSAANQADGGETAAVVVRAGGPAEPLPGTWASPSLLAHCTHQKFALGMPVYRLAADLQRQCALPITRQTVGAWMTGATERWLSLIRDAIADEVRRRDIVHCDETSVRVLKEPKKRGGAGRDCYVWLFAGAEGDGPPCYVFEYGPGRDAGVPVRFLGEGWGGTAVTDGYDGYNRLVADGAGRVSCLVHVRREFIEVAKGAGGIGNLPAGSVAAEAIRRIDRMFSLDAALDGLDPAARLEARRREGGLASEMSAFLPWCRSQLPRVAPGMKC